ncbi:cobalamin biosynthesis protein CobD [Egibacter rhizosphaerae]|uniref:Cobalamin biosynthesis protein CobD n=1 Tax=Egibacter rhizosphaerae TaxID=1670831 RepID=A0A411YF24_9ACTN|nr:adenosylcobinamide-phosphate synthase CbiB [Egibacter rhizosphaerae]QBI19825.1 cobalamin biosynthesis protein CobD [Egibacter rhizosphaerae]
MSRAQLARGLGDGASRRGCPDAPSRALGASPLGPTSGAGPVLGLAVGLLADRVVGDPRRAHPVAAFGAVATAVEHRLWRDARSAGALHVVLLVGAPAAASHLVGRWLERRAAAASLTWLAAALAIALGARSLEEEGRAVGDALAAGDLASARARLPALCGRDPAPLDAAGLAAAAAESVAENTADAVAGPLVWAAIGGPAGVVAHRAANTLDAMVGHRSARYQRFGQPAARLDDALGWLPARMTTSAFIAIAPLFGGSPAVAARVVRRDAARHPSPNAGPCEAAMAGALDVRLGGEVRYPGVARVQQRGPLGDGRAPGAEDVRRAVALSRAAGLVIAVLTGVVLAARDRARHGGGP